MAEPFELELEYSHPYKRTRLFVKSGRAFFGRWVPFDVQIDGDEPREVVKEGQEGQLDLFAHQSYGNRSLWRVIAHANKIDLPLEDVTVGLQIIIPKLANVQAALQAALARAAQVNLDPEV